MLFSNPAINEANELAAWSAPLLLVVPLAAVVSLFLFRRRRPAAVPIGLGVYLLGVVAAMVLGLSVFGNFSNDQFLPLVLFPYPAGLAGLVTLVSAVATTRPLWPQLRRGALSGLIAAVVVGAWILLRGARDWLVAPYGFDIALLIIVLAAGVVASVLVPRTRLAS
jgi:4-amino-4-deoxy-L-arabinose transferase-like glycosyltransferase